MCKSVVIAVDYEFRVGRGGSVLVFETMESYKRFIAALPEHDRQSEDWMARERFLNADGIFADSEDQRSV